MSRHSTSLTSNLISPEAGYGFIPGLNGIRAIAVLIVLAAHLNLSSLIPGGFGVTLFFFISGFLITRLLLAEKRVKGRIVLKQFYIRRFIRLYPALLFMIFGSTLIFWLSGFKGPSWLESLAGIFYFSNIYQLLCDMGFAQPVMAWRPLWSLAVEEHFYLLFPAFMVILGPFRQRFLLGMIALLILIPIWRSVIVFNGLFDPETYTYMMTDARIDSIVWGCLLSVVLAFRMTIRFSLQGMAIFVLILNFYFFASIGFVAKILELKFISYIGVLSYGIYLWHFPILDWFLKSLDSTLIASLLTLPLTFLLAHISYRYVETPFIGLRKKFGAHIVQPSAERTK